MAMTQSPTPGWRSNALLCGSLLLVTGVLYLPYLGHNDLLNEETRKAVIARTMMETGDFVVPRLAEEVYLSKPPLFNWLIALASAPGGAVTEFTARLPSVVALALMAVFMVLTAGRHLTLAGRWLLGVSLLLMLDFMRHAGMAVIETTFTLLVTASLWGWFTLYQRGVRGVWLWFPPALAVIAAYLAKREPALAFYYLTIGAFLVHERRWRDLLNWPAVLAGALTAGVIGTWVVLVAAKAGSNAWLANFHKQVVMRDVAGTWTDYLISTLTYPGELLIATLPVSILLIPLGWRRVRLALNERYGAAYRFAGLAVMVNLPIYWFRAEPEVRYFEPMFPTMALMAVMVFETYAGRLRVLPAFAAAWLRVSTVGLLVMAALLAGAMFVLAIPAAAPNVARPLPGPVAAAALGLAALTLLTVLSVNYRGRFTVVLCTALIGAGLVFRAGWITYRTPHKAEQIVHQHDDVPAILDRIRHTLPPNQQRVQALGRIPHAVWFYDRDHMVVPHIRFVQSGVPASDYLLVHMGNEAELIHFPHPVEPVTRIPYEDGDFLLLQLDRSAQLRPVGIPQ